MIKSSKAIAIALSLCAALALAGCGSVGYNTDTSTIDGLEISDGTNCDVTTDTEEVDEIISALSRATLAAGRTDSTDSWPYHVRIFNSDGSIDLVEMDGSHVHYDGRTYTANTGRIISAIDDVLE